MLDLGAAARDAGGVARLKVAGEVRSAAIWKTPRSFLVFILSVETLCVTWLVVANLLVPAGFGDVGRFALLLGINIAYAEGNARIERLSRFLGSAGGRAVAGSASLWCVTAALVLPVGLAGAFTLALYAQLIVRALGSKSSQPYRIVFTAATEIAATMAACTLIAQFGARDTVVGGSPVSIVAVAAAIVIYTLVNQLLIGAGIYLAQRPLSLRSLFLDADGQMMEFASLGLGVLVAVAIVHAPYLSPFSLLVIVVLRRSALVRQLQEQATRDGKTGLLNAAAWRHEAERELVRAERLGGSMSVLMVDLDHFKRLNDSFGHQAGDVALKAVADTLKDALRGYDAVGRFGGEEFIALLIGADAEVSAVVAERLRARIEALALPSGTLTASVGVGVGLPTVNQLDELISVADKALYVAKRSGRNKVHISQAPVAIAHWPQPR